MFRDRSLANKVVVITGSSQGIGKVLAKTLCEKGMSVVLNGRNPDRLKETVNELRQRYSKVLGIAGDITNYADCERIMTEAMDYFGRIDVLINNGSVTMNDAFENVDPPFFLTYI